MNLENDRATWGFPEVTNPSAPWRNMLKTKEKTVETGAIKSVFLREQGEQQLVSHVNSWSLCYSGTFASCAFRGDPDT